MCVHPLAAAFAARRYINGIAIGRGRCVVDDDGLVVPVSKCTVKELRAEATARGTTDAAGMKRPELTALIKVGCGWWVVLHHATMIVDDIYLCWAACRLQV